MDSDNELPEEIHLQKQEISINPNLRDAGVLVVDTNFFIDSCPFFSKLVEIGAEFNILLIVPFVVMRELDSLKMPKKLGKSTRSSLLKAIKTLHSYIKEGHPVVRGQRLDEIIETYKVNDDQIMDCCLYFKEQFKDSIITLLSSDRILITKCLINGIYHKDISNFTPLEYLYHLCKSSELYRQGINPLKEANHKLISDSYITEHISYIPDNNFNQVIYNGISDDEMTLPDDHLKSNSINKVVSTDISYSKINENGLVCNSEIDPENDTSAKMNHKNFNTHQHYDNAEMDQLNKSIHSIRPFEGHVVNLSKLSNKFTKNNNTSINQDNNVSKNNDYKEDKKVDINNDIRLNIKPLDSIHAKGAKKIDNILLFNNEVTPLKNNNYKENKKVDINNDIRPNTKPLDSIHAKGAKKISNISPFNNEVTPLKNNNYKENKKVAINNDIRLNTKPLDSIHAKGAKKISNILPFNNESTPTLSIKLLSQKLKYKAGEMGSIPMNKNSPLSKDRFISLKLLTQMINYAEKELTVVIGKYYLLDKTLNLLEILDHVQNCPELIKFFAPKEWNSLAHLNTKMLEYQRLHEFGITNLTYNDVVIIYESLLTIFSIFEKHDTPEQLMKRMKIIQQWHKKLLAQKSD